MGMIKTNISAPHGVEPETVEKLATAFNGLLNFIGGEREGCNYSLLLEEDALQEFTAQAKVAGMHVYPS